MTLINEIKAQIKQAPNELKYIAWYNIVNFFLSILLSFLLPIVFLLFDDSIYQYSWGQLALFLLPIIFVALNYYLLWLTKKLLIGSKKAFQIMLIFFLIQTVGFESENFSLYLDLGGIPLQIELTIAGMAIKINFIALFFSMYLIGIKSKYLLYINGDLSMTKLTKDKE